MPNYQNGKIYKIINYDNDDIYIGSTCESLSCRLSKHRNKHNEYLKGNCNYITSFKILEIPSAKIILIENFPCNTKEELNAREAYYIRELDCVNKYIPLRTGKEYVEDNKEYVKEWKANYYIENKEKLSEQKKANYEANKEVVKAKQKAYYEANKEAINQRKRDARKNKT